jgi:L-fucose isomerase-like protein
MIMEKITFALYFGNRGFFPGESIASARAELIKAVGTAGFGCIAMPEAETHYGAVETREEGRRYARFLAENAGRFQGVILCMPNFSDENGAMAALAECGVPVLVQAYRDLPGKMDFAHRRDSMCGKFAMCNVLRQNGIKYTIMPPFTSDPGEAVFQDHLRSFAGICRIVSGMRRMNIGAIGARTTAFKTVRVDEIALQRHGINVETFDLAEIFRLMKEVSEERIKLKKEQILSITEFGYEESKLTDICRFGAVTDDLIQEYDLQSVAIRCWNELELAYGIAPCLILSELNERGVQAACEVDISNAVMMRALALAGDTPPMLLDINNNYGMDDNKCILFHCGPVPLSLLEKKGKTIEHLMFAKSYGPGSGVGVNKGIIRRNLPVTFGSAKTENGGIHAFIDEGKLTDDPIEEAFFGTGVVLESPRMQDILDYVGRNGYRHHMSVTTGQTARTVREALENYLGYEVHCFGK